MNRHFRKCVCLLAAGMTILLGTGATYYQISNGSNQNITEFSVCRKVTNGHASGKSLFVPTSTSTEWTTFYSNPPPGVTIASCSGCTVTPGSQNFTTAGAAQFIVPCYDSLTVTVWGGGGGGGAGTPSLPAAYTAGTAGGTSSFGGLSATGGGGGAAGAATNNGGAGGTGSGGTNFTGTAGGTGTTGCSGGCGAGGAAANGGGAGGPKVTSGVVGNAGTAPGGGGSGGGNTKPGGGGGGGGSTTMTYSVGGLTVGGTIAVQVGSGGSGGTAGASATAGGAGAIGRVSITWN